MSKPKKSPPARTAFGKERPAIGYIERHGKGYRLRERIDGKPRTWGSGTYEHCIKLAAQIAMARVPAAADGQPNQGRATLISNAERWYRGDPTLGRKTVAKNLSLINAHIQHHPIARMHPKDVRASDVLDFMSWFASQKPKGGAYQDSPMSTSMVKRALGVVRDLLSRSMRENLCKSNMAMTVDFKRDVKPQREGTAERRPMTRAGMEAMLNDTCLPDKPRDYFCFAMLTGLRQQSLIQLRWGDIHLAPSDGSMPYIMCEHTAPLRTKQKGRRMRTTKTKQTYKILLTAPAVAFIADLLERSGYVEEGTRVFSGKRGPHAEGYDAGWGARNNGDERSYRELFLAAHPGACDEYMTFHDFRHTCATALLNGYLDGNVYSVEEVQVFLAHEDVETTKIYAHPDGEVTRDRIAAKAGFATASERVRQLAKPLAVPRRAGGLGAPVGARKGARGAALGAGFQKNAPKRS